MKLAFLILAHKNPDQVQMLVDMLLDEQCAVFVHIDKKSSRFFNDFITRNQDRPGLRIYSRYKVYWGSYNQIRATFFLLEEACRLEKFDFVKLISGQDLPVRPLAAFRDFLSARRENSFMSFSKLPDTGNWAGRGGLDRVELFWFTHFPSSLAFFFNKLNVLLHLVQNRLGLRIRSDHQLYGGANWFTLNREMAMFVAGIIRKFPRLLRRYRNTRLADEIVLQTILLNSDFANRIVNSSLVYVDWQNGPEYPRTLTLDDVSRIEQSGEFFARKFDLHKDGEVIKKFLSAS